MARGKSKKASRTTAFTARELIVELSKHDPMARVRYEFSADDEVNAFQLTDVPVLEVAKSERVSEIVLRSVVKKDEG